MVKVVVLIAALCAAPAARAQATAPPAPPSSSPSAAPVAAPSWKPFYENSQSVYYIDAGAVLKSGEYKVAALMEYKIPRVIGGNQVWSVISSMKVSCDEKRVATVDNTLYAQRMGSGRVVLSQAANDIWHEPQPNSLGELVWNAACGKK